MKTQKLHLSGWTDEQIDNIPQIFDMAIVRKDEKTHFSVVLSKKW